MGHTFASETQTKTARELCEAHIQELLRADVALCKAIQQGGHTYQSIQLMNKDSKKAGKALASLKTALKDAFTQQGIEANQAAGWASDLATNIQSEIQIQAVIIAASKHDKALYKAAFQSNPHLSV